MPLIPSDSLLPILEPEVLISHTRLSYGECQFHCIMVMMIDTVCDETVTVSSVSLVYSGCQLTETRSRTELQLQRSSNFNVRATVTVTSAFPKFSTSCHRCSCIVGITAASDPFQTRSISSLAPSNTAAAIITVTALDQRGGTAVLLRPFRVRADGSQRKLHQRSPAATALLQQPSPPWQP